MTFQNGTNGALQKLPTAFLLPLLCSSVISTDFIWDLWRLVWLKTTSFSGLHFSLLFGWGRFFSFLLETLSLMGHDSVCLFAETPVCRSGGAGLRLLHFLLDRRRWAFFSGSGHPSGPWLSQTSCSSLHGESHWDTGSRHHGRDPQIWRLKVLGKDEVEHAPRFLLGAECWKFFLGFTKKLLLFFHLLFPGKHNLFHWQKRSPLLKWDKDISCQGRHLRSHFDFCLKLVLSTALSEIWFYLTYALLELLYCDGKQ